MSGKTVMEFTEDSKVYAKEDGSSLLLTLPDPHPTWYDSDSRPHLKDTEKYARIDTSGEIWGDWITVKDRRVKRIIIEYYED